MSNHAHVSKKVNQYTIRSSRWLHLLLTVLLLLCLTLGLAGCTAEEQERPPVTVTAGELSEITISNIPGLSLITEEKEYAGPDVKIRYALQNGTDRIYEYGAMNMSMEVLQDGEWHRLALRTDIAVGSTGDSIGIGPNMNTETPRFCWAGFSNYGDIVPAGTYRLVIGVSPEGDLSTNEYLAAEFDVIE